MDPCTRYQAYYHSVRVSMSAAAIRLLSLFIIPACAPSSVSPLAVLSAAEAAGCKHQTAKFHLQHEPQITEVESLGQL